MTNKQALLDAWLAGIQPQPIPDDTESEVWDPGFDGESRVVVQARGVLQIVRISREIFPAFLSSCLSACRSPNGRSRFLLRSTADYVRSMRN